jgi:cytochrome c-type biogenesis protein CcmH
MIWLGLLAVTLGALSPLLWVILRQPRVRGRRESALALLRAQLVELDREWTEGRLFPEEHEAAQLEVQRRLLAEASDQDAAPLRASRWPLIYASLLIPAGALGLYLFSAGQPGLPAQPFAPRAAAWARDDRLIGMLKARLAEMSIEDPRVFQGYLLLGEAEEKRNRLGEASDAYQKALTIQFDPTLAAHAAEARAESLGQVDDVAADLFRRALAAAPADADWRALAQERLKEAGK